MSNLYDDVSRATGVARDDVKRVAHALGYSGGYSCSTCGSRNPYVGCGHPDGHDQLGRFPSNDAPTSVRRGPNLSIVGVVIVAILGILWSVLT